MEDIRLKKDFKDFLQICMNVKLIHSDKIRKDISFGLLYCKAIRDEVPVTKWKEYISDNIVL